MSEDLQELYVCDMGIAKVKKLGAMTITCTSKECGTYPYMSPEMFKNSKRGVAVDIYSLGCLLIELFGRKRIWEGLDNPGIMLKVLGSYNTPPEGPSTVHLHPSVQDLCSSLCNLDPSKRPSSEDVLKMIDGLEM